MIKTFRKMQREDKERLKYVRTVQNAIPIDEVYDNGIFLVKKSSGKFSNKFSITLRLLDINYLTASSEMQKSLFLSWCAVLNVLDPGSTNKITVLKHRLTPTSLQRFLFHSKNPQFQEIQKEYNQMLLQKSTQGDGMIQEIYLTISVCKQDYSSAKNYFARMESTIQIQLAKMGSACSRLTSEERLKLFHDFYRPGEEEEKSIDLEETIRSGSSAKNYIAPVSMEIKEDYLRIGANYGRALVLHSYPTYLKDSIISDLCEMNRTLIWSMDVIPVPMDEAIREAETKASNVEGNLVKWFRKQQQNHNYTDIPPYDLEQKRRQAREYLNDLTERDQHLMYAVITMVHIAPTKEALDADTETLIAAARTAQCRMDILRWQQLDGLNTSLPYGVRRIEDIMTLTTEGVAGFMPYRSVECQDIGGTYYGQNSISKNMILIDPSKLQSANCIVLGKPGSGKSFFEKRTAINQILATADSKHEILIIDPEREYWPLVDALGGEVVRLSANTKTYINAMAISKDFNSDDNPVTLKTEFMHSLCEQILAPAILTAEQKSMIARCTSLCLGDYIRSGFTGEPPTLINFYEILKQQPEPEAQSIALAIEMFATGSLNAFAKQTNVNIENRLICFDILELGDSMKGIGMLILFDHIWNRIAQNRSKGISTTIICDEFYLMFAHQFTTEFFYKAWKRSRKYNACFTGITQNVDDLLHNPIARTILANSEFLVLLNQAPTDLEQLAELLDISDAQQEFVSNSKVGAGLIKLGKNMIPFEDNFPKDTKIYKLLTTKPGEAMIDDKR